MRLSQAAAPSILRPLLQSHRVLPRTYATASYGASGGDPKADDPLSQGLNPSESKEHPGPPPPAASGGASKATSASASNGGPGPKIYNHTPPTEDSHTDEVRQHNEEYSQRHDRPIEKSPKEEKVDKGFWTGEFVAEHTLFHE